MESSEVELTRDVSPPPPSFTGRLKLQDFMFKSDETMRTGLRRSPRTSTPSITSPSAPGVSSPANKSNSTITKRPRGTSTNFLSLLPPSSSPASSSPSKRKSPFTSTATSTEEGEDQDPATSTTTPSPNKRPKPSRTTSSSSYAPPSQYAHLPLLPDAISANLLVLFIGLNPGIQTARTGHAYAHPTNLFWRLLHSSGVTPRLCAPTEDRQMPVLYSLGLTNIVARPSRNGAELSKAEMDDGVEILEDKVRKFRPESVCIVGKSIWESLWRVRHGRAIKKDEFRYGWQDEEENMGVVTGGEEGGEGGWKGARVFVATSTSGLAATLKPSEKEAIWKDLGGWVERRREERKEGKPATPPGVVE